VLLYCEHLRVDSDDAVLIEDLTCAVDGRAVALVGDVRALGAALSGRGRIVQGSLKVADADAVSAVANGTLGLALGEARFNPSWTALDLLEKSALLTGLTPKAARARGSAVLARFGLPWLAPRVLGQLSRAEFMALELAKALLTEPGVVFVQAPLRGLSSADADWLWPLVERAGHDRSLIVSFDAPLLADRVRLARFERLVFLHQGRVIATGTAEEVLMPAGYLVSVTRRGALLHRVLEERGARVQRSDADAGDDQPTQLLVTSDHAELGQWIAEDAVAHDVPVIELVPLPGAPAPAAGAAS
jgi:ABC-type multidrug transport system ATPase subunit